MYYIYDLCKKSIIFKDLKRKKCVDKLCIILNCRGYKKTNGSWKYNDSPIKRGDIDLKKGICILKDYPLTTLIIKYEKEIKDSEGR